jgi:hypothetical protein
MFRWLAQRLAEDVSLEVGEAAPPLVLAKKSDTVSRSGRGCS